MTKTRLIVFVCFCAAFAAGVAVGVALTRAGTKPRRRSWLGRELNLTAEQKGRMREIWSEEMGTSRPKQGEQRRKIREERDEAIRGLLTEDQKAQYEEVMQRYARSSAALDEARRKAFEEAMERTKEILTDSQRKKYEELLKRRLSRRGRRHGDSGRESPRSGHEFVPNGGR